jgi:hypothetical protein
LSAADLLWAVVIAVVLSLVLAAIEIPNKSKAQLRACLVVQSFFYWIVLSVGNGVTTLLASTAVVQLPPQFASYYWLLCAFFGVFGFEAVLKNTNITMFDRGVLTIQDWIQKALDAAAGAAIEEQENLKQNAQNKLVQKLTQSSDTRINTLVLNKLGAGAVEKLEAEAKASAADPKLYKILQLVAKLSPSEALALQREPDLSKP